MTLRSLNNQKKISLAMFLNVTKITLPMNFAVPKSRITFFPKGLGEQINSLEHGKFQHGGSLDLSNKILQYMKKGQTF